jgi:hypothetical protein
LRLVSLNARIPITLSHLLWDRRQPSQISSTIECQAAGRHPKEAGQVVLMPLSYADQVPSIRLGSAVARPRVSSTKKDHALERSAVLASMLAGR